MGFMYERSAENRAMITGFASRFPFFHHPAFRFEPFMEGYRKYTFGAVAGPDLNIEHLCHEIAHAAEFGPENFEFRAKEWGYHFRSTPDDVDPHTPEGTQRECRTFGIEMRLMEVVGAEIHEDFLQFAVNALGFMDDWYKTWGGMERKDAIQKLILDTRESWTHAEILERVVGWLDQTRLRLGVE